MNILVTGGAGYIGSVTVQKLLGSGFNVIVFDNLENGHAEAVDKRATFIEGNLSDKKSIRQVFIEHKIDAVIDFAAYIAVGESMSDPKKYLQNNVINFVNLLEAISESECRYLIKSSTAAVYGEPRKKDDVPFEESYTENAIFEHSALLSAEWEGKTLKNEELFQEILGYYSSKFGPKSKLVLSKREISKLRIPTSVYGLTKLLDEIIMTKYDNIISIVLRYFNVCGAVDDGSIGEAHPEETHLIPCVINSCIENKPLKLLGNDYPTPDGTTIRDFIHVVDLAEGHIKALHYLLENRKCDTFNLGTGKGSSTLEIIRLVEKTVGKTIEIKIGPRRSGDPASLYAAPDKANKLLGWRAEKSPSEMVESAWKWHKNHPNEYN